jgi:hypothetical protein
VAGYRRHHRQQTTVCLACKEAHRLAGQARRDDPSLPDRRSKGAGLEARSYAGDLWPGITAGMDARCSCTLAFMAGVYQVKVRNASCINHGGPLAVVLQRMERWGVRGGDLWRWLT